jgi:hypothetical protein
MEARKAGRAGGWKRIKEGIRRRKNKLTGRMRAVFGDKRRAYVTKQQVTRLM